MARWPRCLCACPLPWHTGVCEEMSLPRKTLPKMSIRSTRSEDGCILRLGREAAPRLNGVLLSRSPAPAAPAVPATSRAVENSAVATMPERPRPARSPRSLPPARRGRPSLGLRVSSRSLRATTATPPACLFAIGYDVRRNALDGPIAFDCRDVQAIGKARIVYAVMVVVNIITRRRGRRRRAPHSSRGHTQTHLRRVGPNHH